MENLVDICLRGSFFVPKPNESQRIPWSGCRNFQRLFSSLSQMITMPMASSTEFLKGVKEICMGIFKVQNKFCGVAWDLLWHCCCAERYKAVPSG